MERRITSLEEFSVIAVQAMQEFDAAILRLEAANRETRAAILRLEAANRETGAAVLRLEAMNLETQAAVERSHATVQRLMEFIPVIQAEVVRLDSRIDGIEGP